MLRHQGMNFSLSAVIIYNRCLFVPFHHPPIAYFRDKQVIRKTRLHVGVVLMISILNFIQFLDAANAIIREQIESGVLLNDTRYITLSRVVISLVAIIPEAKERAACCMPLAYRM